MAEKNPQYGFAHRVNDWDCIVDVLDAGRGGGNVAGNGIELDVGWSTFYDAWIVAHNGFDIALPASEYLHEWLGELKKRLATGRYDESFAALWVDIKTPNAADSVAPEHRHAAGLMRVVEQVRANVPPAVAVVYDIGGRAGFGLGGGSSTGYDAIKHQLLPNEGIGAWAESGEANRIGEFYARFKADGVVRTVMHHGHALNIDEDVLVAINKPAFHAQADPFRFKKVFTWTNATVATIERYVNPANPYHTDGQIVGSPQSQWQGYFGELQDFDNAVARHAVTQRKALRTDDFWGRSGSDAAPFLNLQPSWRWCRKCGGMYFGQTSNGVCPAGGAHDPSWSGPYRMPNSSVVLAGWDSTWRWCRRCQGLFSPRSGNGVCPAGGTHDPSWSGPYSLPAATLTPPFPAQSDWFRCYKCAGMFFIKGAAPTVCPHDHRAHGWDGFSACFTPALF